MTEAPCEICTIARGGGRAKVLYNDGKVVAFLSEKPAVPGHIIVAPSEHFTIFEQVSEQTLAHCTKVTNRISTSVFEALQAQGTNIIINNGVPAGQEFGHFTLSILPRKQNDGLNFLWPQKTMSEEELSTVELHLKEYSTTMHAHAEEHAPPKEQKKLKQIDKKDDLRVRHYMNRGA
ncbi:HIT family protein [Candidatus Woesearchaeota archaeon]|nr:HIT family protein [Candidatus Woesearchaeota archaeon]